MAKSNFIGVIRHDGKKSWIIPESSIPEKMRGCVKPCVLRPKEYACDVANKLAKDNLEALQNHINRYNCVDCLKSHCDSRTIQNILRQHSLKTD